MVGNVSWGRVAQKQKAEPLTGLCSNEYLFIILCSCVRQIAHKIYKLMQFERIVTLNNIFAAGLNRAVSYLKVAN